MILSGNFGIKAESFSWGLTSRLCKEGLDVHAVADGYVSE
jgi:hypothetical protein